MQAATAAVARHREAGEMGAGASMPADLSDETKKALEALPEAAKAELMEKMKAMMPADTAKPVEKGPFTFESGLPDCCTASPDLYKTIAEIPGVARLHPVIPVGRKLTNFGGVKHPT